MADNNHDSRNHFPLKLFRLFPSSLTSCQHQTLTDVAEFTSKNRITKRKKILHDGSSSSFAGSSRGKHKKFGKPLAEYELGSGKIYYSDSVRRRKAKTCRKSEIRKNFSVTEEEEEEDEEYCYAVEKSTFDPHEDFMASMVEMIVEKQITARSDLELLLNLFLSLNQASCHGIIFYVFLDVCQTLFTN